MLDVHPPHSPTHTWKDFFIHVGTICVGLLIAVALEQTVEAIHHREQRLQLQEALRNDSKENLIQVEPGLRSAHDIAVWASSQAIALQQAGPTGPITLSPMPEEHFSVPNTGIWVAAKNDGRVSLLSTPLQTWLTDIDRIENGTYISETSSFGHYHSALLALDLVLRGRVKSPAPGTGIDLSSLAPVERTLAVERLRAVAEAAINLQTSIISYLAFNELIFSTPESELDSPEIDDRYKVIRKKIASDSQEIHYVFNPQ